MTGTKFENRRMTTYLDEVRRELADVPQPARGDLLATVRERLEELPDNASPPRELGPARDYASELRESAGLAPRRRTPLALLRATQLRTKILAALSLLVVVLLVGAIVARAHYQPISATEMFGSSTAPPIDDSLVSGVDYFRYEPGTLIVRGLPVHNSGWATATVEGFDLSTTPALVSLVEMRATPDEYLTGTWERVPRVTSVDIPPHRTVFVYEVLKVHPFAISKGDSMSFEQPALRVRVLGVHHRVKVNADQIGVVDR